MLDSKTTRIVPSDILKRKWEEYKKRFPFSADVLAAGGVHPEIHSSLQNPYLRGAPNDVEDFRNVGRHCVAVALCAEQLCTGEQELIETAVPRALIHDASKRYEVMRRKALRQQGADPTMAYTQQAYETIRDQLRGKIDQRLLDYLIVAGKETGHPSLVKFLTLSTAGVVIINEARTQVEKIVHLADDMTYSELPRPGEKIDGFEPTCYVPCRQRMLLANFPQRYPNLYTSGLGFDQDGNPEDVLSLTNPKIQSLRHFATYAIWQAQTARMLCEEIKKNKAPSTIKDPELYVCDLVNDGI